MKIAKDTKEIAHHSWKSEWVKENKSPNWRVNLNTPTKQLIGHMKTPTPCRWWVSMFLAKGWSAPLHALQPWDEVGWAASCAHKTLWTWLYGFPPIPTYKWISEGYHKFQAKSWALCLQPVFSDIQSQPLLCN